MSTWGCTGLDVAKFIGDSHVHSFDLLHAMYTKNLKRLTQIHKLTVFEMEIDLLSANNSDLNLDNFMDSRIHTIEVQYCRNVAWVFAALLDIFSEVKSIHTVIFHMGGFEYPALEDLQENLSEVNEALGTAGDETWSFHEDGFRFGQLTTDNTTNNGDVSKGVSVMELRRHVGSYPPNP